MPVMCDVDGVLANFDEAFRKTLFEVLGIDHRDKKASVWSLIDSYGITKEQHDIVWASRQLQLNMAAASVFDRSRDITLNLPEGSFYVTARGSNLSHDSAIEFRKLTIEWLAVNGFADHPVIFSDDKVNVCRALNLRTAVDDAPHHVQSLSSDGVKVWMPVHDYNKHLIGTSENILPMYGWTIEE